MEVWGVVVVQRCARLVQGVGGNPRRPVESSAVSAAILVILSGNRRACDLAFAVVT